MYLSGGVNKGTSLTEQRDKVSFTMKQPSTPLNDLAAKTNGYTSPGEASSSSDASSNGKSRLVIKIKDKRKIMYHSVAEADKATSPLVNGDAGINVRTPHLSPTKLVPYNGVSSSEGSDDELHRTAKFRRLSPSCTVNGLKNNGKLFINTNLSLPKSPKRKSPISSPDQNKATLFNANSVKTTPSSPCSPVKKPKKSPQHLFEPVLSPALSTTVNVPGQTARLDGVKMTTMMHKTPVTNGHGSHVSNGDHKYSVVSTSPWNIEPYTAKKFPHLTNGLLSDNTSEAQNKHRGGDKDVNNINGYHKAIEDNNDSLYDHALAPITNGHNSNTPSAENFIEERTTNKTKKHKKHKKRKNKLVGDSPLLEGQTIPGDNVVWVERTKETLNSPPTQTEHNDIEKARKKGGTI